MANLRSEHINPNSASYPEEKIWENQLRPTKLSEFVGQEKLKANFSVFLQAAKERNEALDHTLISGPPGLGKTTLAAIMANELGVEFRSTSGPALEKPADLVGILTSLSPRAILFIDEIHRLSPIVEEYLYPALEDLKIDIVIDKGPGARSITLNLTPFTLIGATTRAGLITAPLRARFGVTARLDYYPVKDLELIAIRSAKILNIEIDADASVEVARRSRGTPRIVNRLLRRLRDFAQVEGKGKITYEIALNSLQRLEIDHYGLDEMDKRILLTIIQKFNGGPTGLNTIAVAVGEDAGTIEEVYEPYLIQEGFLARTPRGRVATQRAYEHFGIINRNLSQETLI
ncbi:MAG: Holliday junction branch migration DNA helicase RuvB [bacterium]|nr:Holliday junction branch migration DNA helicase RuvB [bacterium]